MICLPDVTYQERSDEDEFLILACDGFWDVYSNIEGARLVRKILLSGETNMQLVAEELIHLALMKGTLLQLHESWHFILFLGSWLSMGDGCISSLSTALAHVTLAYVCRFYGQYNGCDCSVPWG